METGRYKTKEKNQNTFEFPKKSSDQQEFEELIYSNPFLFDVKNYPETYLVIEDFYIKHKDGNIKFEEFIRTDTISLKDKKRTISNQISEWEKDAEAKIFETFRESKDTILKCRVNKLYKFDFKHYLFLLLGVAVSALFLLGVIPIKLSIDINYNIFLYVLMAISILGMIIVVSKGRINRKFMVALHRQKINHDALSKKALRKLSKNASKVRKYYLKKYKDEIFMKDPLLVKNINYVGEKLISFKKSIVELDKLNERVSNISRKKTEQKLAIFLSYLTLFISVTYIFIALALFIIEKIK